MVGSEHEIQHRSGGGGDGRSVATTARLVLIGVVLVLFVLFCAINTDGVPVAYVFGTADVPLILVMAASAVLGALVSALLRFRRQRS